jgi:hypothetical protein
MRSNVALGFRVHSGWAALVALAGGPGASSVIERARIQLADSANSGPFQPYHRAAEMSLAEAEAFLRRCSSDASSLARRSLGDVLDRLRERDCVVDGCGILFGSGRQPGTLAEILSSHAMIHTAEGEFFRKVLGGACEHHGQSVTRVKERELWTVAEQCTKMTAQGLQQHLAVLGKSIGPPWRQDEKYACLAAWIVMAEKLGATS